MHYICIHGHFYQPARENPWTGDLDRDVSAAPYNDWNERICAECYAPNAAAKLVLADGGVRKVINNYAGISFNFGPTLLGWLECHFPDTYAAIIAADQESAERFSGHGSAIAQMYNHTIAPLDTDRDIRTQALWGIRDFARRFGRRPEGIWLGETGVNSRVLETLAELGIRFTILAPHQAEATRPMGSAFWQKGVDTARPYLWKSGSGRTIAVFFYDGAIAQEVAFGGLLRDGRVFSDRLLRRASARIGLTHIATDGETYGHHHQHGETALAVCLERIGHSHVRLTNYGEYLSFFPPIVEVKIVENSSWSCVHGVERWRSDCGCSTGAHSGWSQAWRAPLREAMAYLRNRLADVYEQHAGRLLRDPWQARDDYIWFMLDPSGTEQSLSESTGRASAIGHTAIGLLEMERMMMLALSSDGWFFDDITEPTGIQVMRCACRAMELCRELTGIDLEPGYLRIIGAARSNIPEMGDGCEIWRRLVRRRKAEV